MTLLYMIICNSASYLVMHMGKCMNCDLENMSIFNLIFDNEFMDFIV